MAVFKRFRRSSVSWLAIGGSAIAVGAALASPAAAQEAAAEEDEVIVVTGSRIAVRDNAANTPIVTVSTETLENSSGATLDSQLQQALPQLAGSATSQFGAGGFATGAATLNLRNLGDNRNLVLLEGRRLQPSTASFAIDINTIPSVAIGGIEVISGGASAVYGSDAMSGVVNFQLKRNFVGLELDGQAQVTEHGGADSYNISGLFGSDFADDAGHILIAADYTDRQGLLNSQRDFYRRAALAGSQAVGGSQFLDYGFYIPGANAPSQAALDAYFGEFGAPAGSVIGANPFGIPATNIGFNNDLSLFNAAGPGIYNFLGELGELNAISQGPFGASVVQSNQYDLYSGAPLERFSLFADAEYEVGGNVSAFFQGYYTSYQSLTSSPAGSAANFWARTIPYDAAHPVPDDLAALLDSRSDPTAPFTVGSSTTFAGSALYTHDNDVYQFLAGVRGDIDGGFDGTWELYGSHGRTQIIDRLATGAVSFARLNEVQTAANYGAAICAGGISPFGQLNPADGNGQFPDTTGNNSSPLPSQIVSAECLNYVSVNPVNRTEQKQDVIEFNVQGSLAQLPAGDLRVAAGAAYRRNSYAFAPDSAYAPIAALGGASDVIGLFGQLPTNGRTSVKEAFAEILIPVLSDMPFVQELSLDAAYRYSDYNTSGGVNAYKIDANWEINDTLRIRGGYQRAVRAPNVVELFGAPQQIFQFNSFDPCSVQTPDPYGNNPGNPDRGAVQALCAALTPGATPADFATFVGTIPIQIGQLTGNPDLDPEKGETYTLGLVVTPSLGASKLSLSIDYYNISIDGAINNIGAGDQMALCFNSLGGNPTYDPASPLCTPLGRAPIFAGGFPTTTAVRYENQGGIKTAGIDVQLNAGTPVGPGMLRLDVVASYLDTFKRSLAPGFPELEYADTPGGYFEWKTYSTLSYDFAGAVVGLRHRFLDSVGPAPLSPPGTPGVDAYHMFDAFVNYDVNEDIALRFGVDNIGDREPPIVGGLLGSTDPSNYDILGRRYYAGASVKF